MVTNLTGLSDDAFRSEFPSAGEAYLLDSGAERLDAILTQIRGDDPLAAARRRLKEYLLGASTPDAMSRFATAVDAAYDAAVAAIPRRVAAGAG